MKPTFFLSLLLLQLSQFTVRAQQPFAIKPYAITLPRVTTLQQTNPTTVPQQAGNMVYNTDQQAVAVNNGTGWGYLGADDTGEFKNAKTFHWNGDGFGQTWTIPEGVTQFVIEAWGGGCGGGIYNEAFSGPLLNIFCSAKSTYGKSGGAAGGYIRRLMTKVSTSSVVSLTVGGGGGPAFRPPSSLTAEPGENTIIRYNGGYMTANGGSIYEQGGLANDNFSQSNSPGSSMIRQGGGARTPSYTYTPIDATNYVITIYPCDGGLSYGALPGQAGIGEPFSLRNGTTLVFGASGEFRHNQTPGVGGGCGYRNGSWGANGLVIIRW